jgi:hypothetical protein
MKAERRHQLKQNTLAHSLEALPELGRRHGTKILIVVAVGLLVALLIRNRVTSARAQADKAASFLSNGRDLVGQLRETSERVSATQFVTVAQEISKGVDEYVQQVLELSDDPKFVAEARLVQGDLNWELASIPEPPGATTRPQLALPRSDEQLLQAAADAYQAVIADGSAPKETVTSARMGLAAVYENQKKWEPAREQYQKVVDDAATAKPLKDLAASALSRLQLIQKAPLMAAPATVPAATQSATAPTSAPTHAPATTGPADAQPPAAPATAPGPEAEPAPQAQPEKIPG